MIPSPKIPRRRLTTRRALLAAASAAAVTGLAVGPVAVSANNDPHRQFLPAGPIDLVGYCSFTVHVEFPVDREYGTITTEPDGSTLIKVTGALFNTFTNEATGKSVYVNASGPGTFLISPDGSTVTTDGQGQSVDLAPNLTAFGFPSNLVENAGPVHYVQASGFGTMTSFSGHINVLTDICAALS